MNNKQSSRTTPVTFKSQLRLVVGDSAWFTSDLAVLSLIYGSRSVTPVCIRPRQLPNYCRMPRLLAMSYTCKTV